MNPTPGIEYIPSLAAELDRALPGQWNMVVWNDAVNLISYVAWVFKTYFGYSHGHVQALMRETHYQGHAVVSTENREQMEADVLAMSGYGL